MLPARRCCASTMATTKPLGRLITTGTRKVPSPSSGSPITRRREAQARRCTNPQRCSGMVDEYFWWWVRSWTSTPSWWPRSGMRQVVRVVSGWAGAWAGATALGAAGAEGGSVEPGLGTAVGGVVCGVVGAVGGYFGASWAAGEDLRLDRRRHSLSRFHLPIVQ